MIIVLSMYMVQFLIGKIQLIINELTDLENELRQFQFLIGKVQQHLRYSYDSLLQILLLFASF